MKENIEEVIEFLNRVDIKNFLSGMAEQSGYIVGKADEVNEAIELLLSDYKRLQEEFRQVDNECFRLEQKELRLEKEIEELKSDNLEYQRTQDIFDERKYRKKYLEERRAEAKTLLYPDADEIYERYYKLKAENEEWQKAYQEEKDKQDELALHIITLVKTVNNSIPKQKIKDKIEELKEGPLTINENNKYYYETDAYNKIIIQVLQDLLRK